MPPILTFGMRSTTNTVTTMCDCPAHRQLVGCTCSCDHTDDRTTQWRDRAAKAEAEADRLREAIEKHRRDILGPRLDGMSHYADVDLWDHALAAEDGDDDE